MMKSKIIVLLHIILFCICASLSANTSSDKKTRTEHACYEITKIDSVENVYIIYAQHEDELYKIVTEKPKSASDCDIKVGDVRALTLKLAAKAGNTRIDKDEKNLSLKPRIYGVRVRFEDECQGELYLTDDIKGLLYTENVASL